MKSRAFITFLICVCASTQALAGDYQEDANGRPFRVNFPLHDRFWVSGGTADTVEPSPEIAMEYQVDFDLGFDDEEIWWQLRSGLLKARLTIDGTGDASLARGEYLRHDVSSFIVVPAEVDWRIPAPFDLAVDWRLLTLAVADFEAEAIEPVAMSFSADFCRDETFRSRCALGVNTAYSYDFAAQTHEITSFSTGSARVQYQSANGRFAVGLKGDAGWKLYTHKDERNWKPGWAVTGSLEWVLLAINDQPISLVAEGEHDQWNESTKLGLALRVSFPGG